jgi:hypothetical protein
VINGERFFEQHCFYFPATTALFGTLGYNAVCSIPTAKVLDMISKPISKPIRKSKEIRYDCARKLQSVKSSNMFRAILASLLDENWTTPNISELRITRQHRLLGRSVGEERFKAFRCAEIGLIRSIHGIAAVAQLDGDEVGYLLGRVAEIKDAEINDAN